MSFDPQRFVARFHSCPWVRLAGVATPWQAVAQAAALIEAALATLDGDFAIAAGVAVHRTATVEAGAVVKPPAILGPRCFVAATAYLRGGVLLEEGCTVGPGAELKTAFVFRNTKLAHLNFVGDSILGEGVNIEAGATIANYRNERADPRIRIAWGGQLLDTGLDKFGALVGDGTRIGANAVIAPGALLPPATLVHRLQLIDQDPGADA